MGYNLGMYTLSCPDRTVHWELVDLLPHPSPVVYLREPAVDNCFVQNSSLAGKHLDSDTDRPDSVIDSPDWYPGSCLEADNVLGMLNLLVVVAVVVVVVAAAAVAAAAVVKHNSAGIVWMGLRLVADIGLRLKMTAANSVYLWTGVMPY